MSKHSPSKLEWKAAWRRVTGKPSLRAWWKRQFHKAWRRDAARAADPEQVQTRCLLDGWKVD